MDTGKQINDYKFYKGYEGENDVVLSLEDTSYHFWDGFFEDIFGNPQMTKGGWEGFTRDYNEFVNTFDEECVECAILPEEYLKDALLYQGLEFSYKETSEVLDFLITILEEATEKQICIFVQIN